MGADQINIQSTALRPEGYLVIQPLSDLEIQILWHLFEASEENRTLHAYELCGKIGGDCLPVLSAANGLQKRGLLISRLFMVHLTVEGKWALLSLTCAGKLREFVASAQLPQTGVEGGQPSTPAKIAGRAEASLPNDSPLRESATPTAITPAYSTGTAPQAGSVPVISEHLADAYDDGHARGVWSREIHLVNPSRRDPVKFHAPETCDCGRPKVRACANCEKPICHHCGYPVEKDAQDSPIVCGECKGEAKVESAAEVSFGRADAGVRG